MKNRIFNLLIPVALLLSLACAQALAHGDHDHEHLKKKGILLVTFGSSYPQAQAAFENIEAKVREAFPETEVHWAYTSKIIRHKLAKQGQKLDSPAQALANMMEQGFTHVAVQSLHTIPGAEFHDLQSILNGFDSMSAGLQQIQLGRPLLATDQDLQKVSLALLENIPGQRKPEQAVIFMGHGSHHPSNAFYKALAYELQGKDTLIYVGTVEDSPSIQDIKNDLLEKGVEKAFLMPFMSVAGDHVRNDMAGHEPDSWKSILNQAGIETEAILKGTAEYDNIVDIWMDHLQAVFFQL